MKRTLTFTCFILLFLTQDVRALEKRSPKKQCTLCHIRWLEAFTTGEETLVELSDTGILVSGALSDVTTRRMCYSCHDGYVADSRAWLASENKHLALKKVPQGFHLPEGLRLNMNHEFYCGTCHGFHDIEAEGTMGEVPFVRRSNEYSQMCLACHADQGEMQKVRNHPVRTEPRSPPPQGLLVRHAKFGPDGAVICQSCHGAHSPGVVLAPVEDSALCLFCHGDKQRKGTTQDAGPWTHPVNVKPDRNLEDVVAQLGRSKLGAGGKVICTTCHSTHEGAGPYVLVSRDGSVFCQRCHTGEAETLSGTKHDLSKTVPGSRNLRGQSPEQSGMCGACHLAHGWAQAVPQGSDPFSGACLACHRQGGWAEKETVGTYSHPLNVSLEKKLETDLPLRKVGGEQRVVCSTCHEAHRFWPGPQRPVSPLDVDGDPTNSFLRIDSRTLCRECHPEKELVRDTKHDLTHFGKPLEKKVEQDLARGGPCFGCHYSHNAQAGMLWFSPLRDPTGDFDRQEASRRCLSCHADAAMKRIQEERGHPVGKEVEVQYMPKPPEALQLGKAETPSGQVHVLICTTCHLPHGARIPDGSVRLFAGGGLPRQALCVSCHGPKEQVIGSPHDFRTRKPGEYIPDEVRSREYGACAGCHTNHNSRMEKKLLWFEIPKPKGKGNPEDMFCLYCHNDPRIRKERTKFYAHPRSTEIQQILEEKLQRGEVTSEEMAEKLATASSFGYETIFFVRCVTCHDNHRWVASPTDGGGEEPVNTELASFLRGSIVAKRICSKCHGVESLYRYRFFHQDRVFRQKIPNQ